MKFAVDPPPGLVSDETTFSELGRYYDMDGARFYDGRAQILGGYESITQSMLAGVCRTVMQWSDIAGNTNIAFGEHNALEVLVGGELANITPLVGFTPGNIDGAAGLGYGTSTYGTGTYGTATVVTTFPLTWSLSNYGEALIANARGQGIFQWSNNTAVPAALLAGAPAVATYTLVVPQRQIIAFGCTNTSGTFDPLCIRGSDIEGPTTWTPTSANNSFEYFLDSGSRIVAAAAVANYLFVWTDAGFYLGTFIGAPDETWRFEKQGSHCGLIGPNVPVIVGQTARWISPDVQFWIASIGGEPQIIPCQIRDEFADNIAPGQADKIVGSTNSQFNEVRWFYPDGRDGYENSREIAFNEKIEWCKGLRPRTAYCDANPSDSPIGITYGGNVYWHERGETADGGQLTGFLTTTDFYLGEGEELMQINGCWPDFKNQQGTMSLTVSTRLYPQDTRVRTRGPYQLTPNKRKCDFRATGRVAQMTLSWASSPAKARMGKFIFDLEPAGER